MTHDKKLAFGLDTFGDVTVDADGSPLSHAQVIRNVVAQAELADQVGVDAIGIGEHHRSDFAVSAPDMVLAAIASRTRDILLGTAVTVLSSDDPIRVYERFATLDAVSEGRAEVTLGRGSFTESFPLFGYDLAHYDTLFAEKLELFTRLMTEGEVSFSGATRRPLEPTHVYPKTERGTVPAWVAVGGSPESVVRAADHRLPLMLAIIGGDPANFAPFTELYGRAVRELSGNPDAVLPPIGVHSPGFVADTDAQARELLWPHFKANRDRIGRDRGWPPVTRAQYEHEVDAGSLYVGSPQTVASKIAATVQVLGIDRFDLKYSNGTMTHEHLMSSIDLYGRQVIPRVRQLLD